ncbi:MULTISPECIES: hypothetical protein [Gulbenkiania]|nr:hypothetical protein [Gulbenkiania indica]
MALFGQPSDDPALDHEVRISQIHLADVGGELTPCGASSDTAVAGEQPPP